MAATIVRIVGPSYCGSTALGCAMNTGDGVFFGSEIYRYRSSWRTERNGGRFPLCDFCGQQCEYWSDELRSALAAGEVDSLPSIHQALLDEHPEITMLVDGSKSVPEPGEAPDVVVAPRKHPIRLIASRIYNRRQRLGIESDDLDAVGEEIERMLDGFESVVDASAGAFRQSYNSIAAACPDAHVFRTDEAHQDDFAAFRALARRVGFAGAFDPAGFAEQPAHTIGGNRQPIWMTRRANGQSAPTTPRSRYYASTSGVGDWKFDDKFRILFRPATLELIESRPKYLALCELLEYDPHVAPAAPERVTE